MLGASVGCRKHVTVHPDPAEAPTRLRVEATQLVLGERSGCARVGDDWWCWGAIEPFETEANGEASADVDLRDHPGRYEKWLRGAKSVALGFDHTCALFPSDRVDCVGSDRALQRGTALGGGDEHASPTTPITMRLPKEIANITALVASRSETCVVADAGRVWCWGGEGFASDDSDSYDPGVRRISALPSVSELFLGIAYLCGRAGDGSIWCWGDERGPAKRMLSHASQVCVSYGHACALRDGQVLCWGSSMFSGTFGDGKTTNEMPTPTIVNVPKAKELWLGSADTMCTTSVEHETWCWGWAGRPSSRDVIRGVGPLKAPLAVGARRVVSTAGHACALYAQDRLECWGDAYSAPGEPREIVIGAKTP